MDTKLDNGDKHLAQVLRAHTGQGYAAAVLVLFTLAQRGAFAADGIIAGLVPRTTVIWILALAATLPRARRAARHCRLRDWWVTEGTGSRAVT